MSESEGFGVTITAQMRHAALWQACRQFGSAKALAEHLGVSATRLGLWLNLRAVPCRTRLRTDVAQRLMEVTQQSLEELFPQSLELEDFLDAPKALEHTRSMDPRELAAAGIQRRIPQPDESVELQQLQRVLGQAIAKLPARHGEMLRLRFGLEGQLQHSLGDLAERFQVTPQRCRQIILAGLQRLRRTSDLLSLS